MSNATEQDGIGDQSPHAAHIDALLDRFSALVEHAQAIAFPRLRKGVTAPPDMTDWSKFRRIAFTISSPLPTTFRVDSIWASSMTLSVWCIASFFWLLSADIFLDHIFGFPLPARSQSEAPIWIKILVGGLLAFTTAFFLAAYWRWIFFWCDRRYSRYWRLILTLLFVGIAVSFPYWGFDPEYRVQFPTHLLQNRADLRAFVFMYIVFLIPSGTFYFMFALDIVIWGAWLCWVTLKYLFSAHDPFPRRLIRRLALEPIPASKGDDKEWRLIELTKAELEFLRNWAVANREGTEKRLLPTAILFGILAIFADTQAFSDFIDQALAWLYSSLTPTLGHTSSPLLFIAGQYIVALLVITPLALFIYALLLLFRNLVAQSLIVEVCIAAEYVCEQCQSPDSRNEMATDHNGFWAKLLRLLWRR